MPMTEPGGAALETALAYHRAWTGGDFERAMSYVADDIAAFGDDETAVLMYDTDTVPVKDAPGAECLTVRDGKISHLRIIFDRLPFEQARRPAGG
jgi:hypothetical protein